MESWIMEIRHALRVLRNAPAVTSVVVLALALGIGANVAIFSLVSAVLLRPLPYQDSDRLVQIWGQMPARNIPFHFVPYPDFAEWVKQSRSFEHISAYRPAALNLTNHGEARRLNCLLVNAGFFPMAGVPLLHGRSFTPEEDTPDGPRVVVMNHPFFVQEFGADPNTLGKSIMLDGASYTVIGILPEDFQLGGNELDLYLPLAASDTRVPRNMTPVGCYARLKPGHDRQTAQTEIDTITVRLNQQYPIGISRSVRVWGLREFMVRDVRLSLWILAGAVGLVLLIACANVANILLARADIRRREMTIRAALGADRKRLIRQVLSESVILGLAGGGAGAVLAYWGIRALVGTSAASYPLLRTASLDAGTIAFTVGLSVLTGVIFGIGPAITMARQGSSWGELSGTLKEGSSTVSTSRSSNRIRALLVVMEVALSLMLLIGSGLLVRSFLRLQELKPGFDPHATLTASVTLPSQKYPAGPQRLALYRQFLDRLEHSPGVDHAGIVDSLPLSGSNSGVGILPEGRPLPRPGEAPPIAWLRFMSEGYFKAMSIPLLAGRQFSDSDNPPAPPVAIINRTLARRFWPGEDPLGKRFTMGQPGPNVPAFTIIGVAGDVRHTNLTQEPEAEFFLYYRQSSPARVTVVVKTQSDPLSLANTVRQALASVDKDLPIARIQTMQKFVDDAISSRRLTMLLLTIFSTIAIILAAVGIYGVISYSVAQRKHEIGIRMALGASNRNVLWMITAQAMVLALTGVAIGLAGTFALRRVIDSQLYGSTALDPAIFAAAPLLLIAVALMAAMIPARRALRVNPLIALRRE